VVSAATCATPCQGVQRRRATLRSSALLKVGVASPRHGRDGLGPVLSIEATPERVVARTTRCVSAFLLMCLGFRLSC